MLAVPVGAMMARRAIVVVVPLGVSLLVLAAVLDRGHRPLGLGLRRLSLSPGGLAGGLILFWCGLSLVWTPFAEQASERLLNIVGTVAVAIAGYLALPDRTRSANLYILPVGTAAAAVVAILIALFDAAGSSVAEQEGQSLERGLTVLVLLMWPALAWLRSRERDLEALVLAVMVALSVVLGPQPMPLVALVVGAAVFAITAASPSLGIMAVGVIMASIVALAPLIPFVLRPVAAMIFGPSDPFVVSLDSWQNVVVSDPVRLITGHGFETALRGRLVGLLPQSAPSTLPFEIWYELGIVGAAAAAVALYSAARTAGHDHPPLVPGVMAAFGSAFTFACLGIGTAQMWWLTALAATVLIFVAAERGQFRTKRPKALLRRTAREI